MLFQYKIINKYSFISEINFNNKAYSFDRYYTRGNDYTNPAILQPICQGKFNL